MLRNTIVEVCCCNSKLLHFFDKSSIEGVDVIVVLRDSFHHEELLDADDHRFRSADVFGNHDLNDHDVGTRNIIFPSGKKNDDP